MMKVLEKTSMKDTFFSSLDLTFACKNFLRNYFSGLWTLFELVFTAYFIRHSLEIFKIFNNQRLQLRRNQANDLK